MPIQRAKPRLVDLDQTPLTSSSSITTSQLPAGSVVQIQHYTKYNGDGVGSSYTSVSSTTLAASEVAVTITPVFSSSKILIHVGIEGLYNEATGGNAHKIALYKSVGGGSFSAVSGLRDGQFTRHQGYYGDAQAALHGWSGSFVDSPSTTSTIIYKIYHARLHSSSGYSRIMANADDSARIQAIEIKQ